MQTENQQEISETLRLLMHTNLKPQDMSGKIIYGNMQKVVKKDSDRMVFRLSNETGDGTIAVYSVFSGIELYYNDVHMSYCNQNQTTAKNMIEINHCLVGRFECSFGENSCCIMRANPSIEHIFSELYHIREQRKSGYMKIKILELLLFLSDLNKAEEVLQTDYYNQSQVTLIKSVAAYITEDLTAHHTIEQLSQKFEISATTLKKCFRGVYGTSVYAYLRTYRLQTAQKMLLETKLSVTEIAGRIGYENPNKFTSAFREIYGASPTEFRKSVFLDRKQSMRSGEEI